MIVEVNNTFDERRNYVLKNDALTSVETESNTEKLRTDDSLLKSKANVSNGPNAVFEETSKRFSSSWVKDFHVSPFNSRKGSYALSAKDIYTERQIDNVITLSSSKDHLKLVARIFSTGSSLDHLEWVIGII